MQPVALIQIALMPDGSIQFSAPSDKVAALGILELAKAAVLAFKPEDKPQIEVASRMPGLNGSGGMKR